MNLPLPEAGPRKEAIFALTPPSQVIAEIGADHGITSAYLLRLGIAGRMIVSDISAASLLKARRLFALHGLEESAAFCVANGLDALTEPVGAAILAGMGAKTIAEILLRGRDAAPDAAFILQPSTDPPYLRRFLMENGYRIEDERLAFENRRYYVAMRARRGRASYTEKEILLGPRLLAERPPLFPEYLAWRKVCLARVRRESARGQIAWIEQALEGR